MFKLYVRKIGKYVEKAERFRLMLSCSNQIITVKFLQRLPGILWSVSQQNT